MIRILACVVGAALAMPADYSVESNAPADFDAWRAQFHKSYATVEEEAAALAAFTSNSAIIAEHNAKGLSYWLGHNEFSDLTWE